MDQQTNNIQAPQGSIITDEQKQDFLTDLGLQDLSEEKKQELVNQMIDTVMLRIFNRLTYVLTEDDISILEELDSKPEGEALVNQFLLSRVPNIDGISREEVARFKAEMKDGVAAMDAALQQ